jgi:Domain of unknown function DUF302.
MINSTTFTTVEEKTYPITLATYSSPKPFDAVIEDFEKELGWLNEQVALSSEDYATAIRQMEGPSGLMIIRVLDMERLIPAFQGSSRARQYLVGNPLIASEMAVFDHLAALYAPPRVLIYTREGATRISYDKPTSTFGRLRHDEILQIARVLDGKFETLARQALGSTLKNIQE